VKHFLVIGLGRFGRAVAEALAERGGEVIAVDTDMSLVEAVRDKVEVAAQVDSVEADALRTLGAATVDAAVVGIGEDFAAAILTVAILKELGVGTIVARANTDRERLIMQLVGATRIVSVESEMGERIARSLLGTDVVDHVSLGSGASIVYWTADERVLGRRLDECGLREKWQLNLIAVRRDSSEKLELLPGPDYVFQASDVLLLLGADSQLAAFTKAA
jgi:trk system potassium uptake protein TrkA